MSTAKHTALPWAVEIFPGVTGAVITADKGCTQVANCADADDAAIIVQAVNQREGLVPAVCDEAANEIERLSELSVDLREEYLHLMRKVQATYDLLSGEFYAEALGELHDMLNPNPQSQYQAQEGK